jgi:hypothetical protein
MAIIYKIRKRHSQPHRMKIDGGGYALDLTDRDNPTPCCTVRFREEWKDEEKWDSDKNVMELKLSKEEVEKLEEYIVFFKDTLAEVEKNQREARKQEKETMEKEQKRNALIEHEKEIVEQSTKERLGL